MGKSAARIVFFYGVCVLGGGGGEGARKGEGEGRENWRGKYSTAAILTHCGSVSGCGIS